jgi:hypothetical protein
MLREKYIRKREKRQKGEERRKEGYSLVPVAHAFNPSYSGGRGQEDPGLKPAPGK